MFPKRMSYAPLSFNSILNEVFNDNFHFGIDEKHHTPLVNIKETKEGYQLEVAAPGMSKENFSITVEKDLLSISAEKENEAKNENEKFTRKEFSYTKFKRSFTLPETIDAANIKAVYENGILKVNLFKKEEVKIEAQKIEIA
jgi:HSP20 family protein